MKTWIAALAVLLLIGMVSAYTKYDYLTLLTKESNPNDLTNPYSVFQICNPTTALTTVAPNQYFSAVADAVNSKAYRGFDIYILQNQTVTYSTMLAKYDFDSCINKDIPIGFDFSKCQYTLAPWNNTVNVMTWVLFNQTDFKFSPGICYKIKVQGYKKAVLGYDAVDIIPSFYGYSFPEYQWWDSSWAYRKQHNITGSTLGAQTNYPVEIIVVNGSSADSGNTVYINNKAKNDFGDIRFTDNSDNALNYWMESVNNAANATFWVNVSSIGDSTTNTTIKIYYGNSGATTTSSAASTFSYYTNFPGASLPADWVTQDTVCYTVNNGLVINHCNSVTNGMIRGTTNFTQNYSVRFNGYLNSTAPAAAIQSTFGFRMNTYITNESGLETTDTTTNTHYLLYTVVSTTVKETPTSITAGTTATWDVRWTLNNASIYQDDAYVISNSTVSTASQYIGSWLQGNAGGAIINWVAVRKYVNPEPTHVGWGAEEEQPAGYDSFFNVTWNSPTNNTWNNSQTLTTEYTPIWDVNTITSCSLWTNVGGNFASVATNSSSLTNNTLATLSYNYATDSSNILSYVNCTNGTASNNTGNYIIKIDTTAPSTSASGGSYTFGTWTKSSSVSVTLTCYDAGSGCLAGGTYYCLDTNNNCVPNIQYTTAVSISTSGVSYIRYNSTDNIGWYGAVNSSQIKIDIANPSTTATPVDASSNPYTFATWSKNPPITVTLSCSDSNSGCLTTKYCLDASNTCNPASGTTYSTPVPISTAGTSYVRYNSTDNAGNIETINSGQVMIDTTAPSTAATGAKSDSGSYTFNTWTNASYVDVTLTCSDNGGGSGCHYTYYCTDTVNSCTPSSLYPSSPIHITTQGTSYIRYYSIDNAGNSETLTGQTLKIDSVSPSTSATAVTNASTTYTFGTWTNSLYVNVTLTCSDGSAGSGCYSIYWCNDTANTCTPDTLYAGVFQILTNGTSYIRYNSTDDVGNYGTIQSHVIMIDPFYMPAGLIPPMPIGGINGWEGIIGGGLGTIFGSGSYCFGGGSGETCQGVSLDIGYILMSLFIMGFIFIWSSVSGIAWDGIFFLMMIVLVILAMPGGGLLGSTAWGLYIFVWGLIIMAILYKTVFRRG